MNFPTDYKSILQKVERVKPLQYASTRNFTDGAVSYLSPYISRGVISLAQVARQVLKKHNPHQIQKFLQELAWREYWQRVWQHLDDKIFADIKQPQQNVMHHLMPAAINNAASGIETIDKHIQLLYASGYMHNHVRMYVSSIACNIAQAHWLLPSQWMYYHLLDGDLASNTLSWQWIAGTFSSKKYYCNQENINRYTYSRQQDTFLDCSYEKLITQPVPPSLLETNLFSATTNLPQTNPPVIKNNLPVIVYNSYNLDPLWQRDIRANRVLLLEPSHFNKFPVSDKVLNFILALSCNIEGLQIFTGEFETLKRCCRDNQVIFKLHPAFTHYEGKAEKYDELFPQVEGYFTSFSSYWKRCEKFLSSL